jgi:tetratricopeptide (TPR) repeat protein
LQALVLLAAVLFTVPAAIADYDAGLAYWKQGKYAESAKEWEAVVANAPDYAFGWFMLGNCYLKLDKYGDAIKPFRKAVELDPGKFRHHQGLAQALFKQRKYGEVIEVLDKAENVAQAPKEKKLLYKMRGLALAQTKDYQRARRDLQQANPGQDHSVASSLAQACFRLDDYTCLRDAAEKALSMKSDDETSLRLLVRGSLEQARRAGDKTKKKSLYSYAAQKAQKLVAIAGDKPAARELHAAALLGAGNYSQAIAQSQKVLDSEPNNCSAMANVATAYQEQENWSKVIEWAEKTIGCDEQSEVAYAKLALGHNKLAKSLPEKSFDQRKEHFQAAMDAAKKSLQIKNSSFAKEMQQIAREGQKANEHNRQVHLDEQRVAQERAKQRQEELERKKKLEEWQARTGQGGKKDDESSENKGKKDDGSE